MPLPLACLKRDFLKVLQSLRGYIDMYHFTKESRPHREGGFQTSLSRSSGPWFRVLGIYNFDIIIDVLNSPRPWFLLRSSFFYRCCAVLIERKSFDYFISKLWITEGQLISKCRFGVIVWTKIPTKIIPGFLPWPLKRGKIKKVA